MEEIQPKEFPAPDKPKGFIFSKMDEKKALKEEKRLETIKRYSMIVNDMPDEVKQMLTSSMGKIVVTPQESFLSYFKEATPIYDDEVFKTKFVETFQSVGARALEDIVKRRKKGNVIGNDDFWRKFESLFGGMPNSYRRRESFPTRMKILLMNLWQILKMGRKLIFFC